MTTDDKNAGKPLPFPHPVPNHHIGEKPIPSRVFACTYYYFKGYMELNRTNKYYAEEEGLCPVDLSNGLTREKICEVNGDQMPGMTGMARPFWILMMPSDDALQGFPILLAPTQAWE